MRHLLAISLCLILVIMVQGCTNVAMTGAQAVYNRHSWQKSINDQYITMRAFKALNIDSDQFKDAHITIAAFNNEILLAGQVPYEWQRAEAEALVKKIPNVDKVYNLVTLASPSSTLTKMSDAWITAKIKAKFLTANEIDATQIKVVTENGTVYLMGILPPSQAQAAIDIASNTAGVVSVVKMFSYIKISKQM